MLFSLLTSLIDQYSFLTVFKYLTFRTGLSVMTSLIIVFVIGGPLIKVFSEKMITGPWVLGEHFSICDAYLYSLTRWLERDGVEREKLPNVNFHFQKMEKRSSIQRIIHYHEN